MQIVLLGHNISASSLSTQRLCLVPQQKRNKTSNDSILLRERCWQDGTYEAPWNTLSEAFCNSQGISVCDPGKRLVLECNAFRVHSPKCRNRGPWNRSCMAGMNTAETPILSPVGWSQKKHSIPGTAGTGVRSWGKSRTLHRRIYLEIWTAI